MKPTRKQLAYLKSLTAKTGETFTYPKTSAEASREIKRLKARKPTMRSDRLREQRAVERDMDQRHGDEAAYRRFEVTGYGSSARWAHNADDEPSS